MPHYADRVRENSSTTGTSAFVLTGAVTGFQTFASAFGSVALINVGYAAVDSSGNWEVGKGTFNGTTGLTRDTVRASSNAGALTSFGAGVQVFCTPAAEQIDNANIGLQIAISRGMAQP